MEALVGKTVMYAQTDTQPATLESVLMSSDGVTPEALVHWFWARLPWSLVLGALAGGSVGWILARKMRFGVNEIEIDRKARNRFSTFMLLFAVFLGACTWVDIYTYFDDATAKKFNEAWISLENFGILFIALAACVIAASLTTRFALSSRCRYALWPSPKVK
jgi:hypothetical protein